MMAERSFKSLLASERERLPGSARTERWRERAAAAFDDAGFPTRRQERWKYTDLKPIAEGEFALVPPRPDDAARQAVAARLEQAALPLSGSKLVFIDGHYAPELSVLETAGGLELASLEDAWERFEGSAQAGETPEGHPLAMLNTAFTQQGAWIRAAAGRRGGSPVQLVFAGSGAGGLAPQPRVIIDLAEGAELTVVQHYLDAGEPADWLNSVTQVSQAASSRLALYRLQEHGRGQFHTALVRASLAADAELTLGGVDLGGRLIRNDVDVELAEPGARVELFGLFLASDGQHVDNHTLIDHAAPDTTSDEAFRGVIGRRGRGVFNGKVLVRKDAQRVDARQASDNLLLDEQAEIDTKPELEIYADNVKCSHGATVGELDETQLFYLRSRGVDEQAARALLTFAFANAVLARMKLPELRERAASRVAGHLPDHEQWEQLV
jgi:Fe-S cluster assembly protein SufD